MKKQRLTSLTLLASLLILAIVATPFAESYIRPWRFSQQWPAVYIHAHCNIMDEDISIKIGIDSSGPGFKTPYTFVFPTGNHSITAPKTDSHGHPFMKWNTGEETTTISLIF